ncbi:MAG TPA: SDR family NAD(P)-dependent oxidoreductase [Pyrinomonadaceae bacterium]
MAEIIKYILQEVKSKRLSKAAALSLISDYQRDLGSAPPRHLHPLLHRNVSTFARQSYCSTLTGEEFFLRDHMIAGKPVLPAVAYLEMAVAAITESAELPEGNRALRLANVVWYYPLTIEDGPRSVCVSLTPEDDGAISFEIQSDGAGAEGGQALHCQGQLNILDEFDPDPLDVEAFAAGFAPHPAPPSLWYEQFAGTGIHYGASFQAIERVLIRDAAGGRTEVLARLALPAGVAGTELEYTLHPALMDAALQASAGVFQPAGRSTRVPFSIDAVSVYAPCPARSWVWARHSDNSRGNFARLDIDILDAAGRACVRLRGYANKTLEVGRGGATPEKRAAGSETLYLRPAWREKEVSRVTPEPAYRQELTVLINCEPDGELAGCLVLDAEGAGEAERYGYLAEALFIEIARILRAKGEGKTLLRVVIPHSADGDLLLGLSGLLRTASLENPKLATKLIQVEHGENFRAWWEQVAAERGQPADEAVRYAGRRRYVSELVEAEKPVSPARAPWKDGGVYLITGGAGGIGLLLSAEISSKSAAPVLILTGRSSLSEERLARLDELRRLGATVEYHQTDVTDADAVAEMIAKITGRYGTLDGVIHSAGLTDDSFILRKSVADFRRVLAPKVAGTVNLDSATQDLKLDLFILFSSVSGVFGNPGQADYAAANGFLDAFAERRNRSVEAGTRHGRTLSVSWPLWEGGGMRLDEQTLRLLERETGVRPLKNEDAWQALYDAVGSPEPHRVVLAGDVARMKSRLLTEKGGAGRGTGQPLPAPAAPSDSLSAESTEAERWLCGKIARLLGVMDEDVDPSASFEELGLERAELSLLGKQLSNDFGVQMTVTSILDSGTIDELARLLAGTVRPSPAATTHAPEPPAAVPATPVEVAPAGPDELKHRTVVFIKELLSSVLKLPAAEIDADEPFGTYGLESVMTIQMSSRLESFFGPMSKTLLFEFETVNALVGHFLDEYADKLPSVVNAGTGGQPAPAGATTSQIPPTSDTPPPPQPAPPPAFPARGNIAVAQKRFRPVVSSADKAPPVSEIAVIGLAGRYPKAANVEELWQNLCAGMSGISEIPPERWEHARFFDEDKDKPGKTYSKWGGFLDGVDEFDAPFFHVTPNEALLMDPQERLFLQCVYEALEDAGYTRQTLAAKERPGVGGKVALFVGAMYLEYQFYGVQQAAHGQPLAITNALSAIANRASYFFNFNGPSVAVDTMSSSSLTAIHLACEALAHGSSKVAVAGGVNVSVHPNKYRYLAQVRFLSSSGRNTSFGEGGDGYVPSEGVGAVVLKPLRDAVADGDHIYGVIKGSAIGHSGRTNSYTVPSPTAQANVVAEALERAGVDARSISYVEAHGIGTPLGDPIEIAGLSKAFATHTSDKQFCAIGSVKSNIGHCESAAGMAGLTKVLLQMKHGRLVPSLNSEPPNPNINFAETPFTVQRTMQDWNRPTVVKNGATTEYPRRAGVSSFGAAGSNAHVIVEEYVATGRREAPALEAGRPVLIVLSARDEDRLRLSAERLLRVMERGVFSDAQLDSVAYTLQTGREAMESRFAAEVDSVAQLVERLKDFLSGAAGQPGVYLCATRVKDESLARLSGDEDMTAAVAAWLEKRRYSQLAELWVKGFPVEWAKLYRDGFPGKVSLPTYPFAKERHWFPEPSDILSGVSG